MKIKRVAMAAVLFALSASVAVAQTADVPSQSWPNVSIVNDKPATSLGYFGTFGPYPAGPVIKTIVGPTLRRARANEAASEAGFEANQNRL